MPSTKGTDLAADTRRPLHKSQHSPGQSWVVLGTSLGMLSSPARKHCLWLGVQWGWQYVYGLVCNEVGDMKDLKTHQERESSSIRKFSPCMLPLEGFLHLHNIIPWPKSTRSLCSRAQPPLRSQGPSKEPFGSRAFSSPGPSFWNSLLEALRWHSWPKEFRGDFLKAYFRKKNVNDSCGAISGFKPEPVQKKKFIIIIIIIMTYIVLDNFEKSKYYSLCNIFSAAVF